MDEPGPITLIETVILNLEEAFSAASTHFDPFKPVKIEKQPFPAKSRVEICFHDLSNTHA